MEIITLQQLKDHLEIESDYTTDDSKLILYKKASELSIIYNLRDSYDLTGLTAGSTDWEHHWIFWNVESGVTYSVPADIQVATLLLAAHFYLTRTPIAFAQPQEIPFGFKFLLSKYKIPKVC